MLIATYLDADAKVVDFFAAGSLCCFDDSTGSWTEVGRAPLSIRDDLPLAELKETFSAAISLLGDDVKVFLAKETRGILRVFLEELDFRVWKSRGHLEAQLDDARGQELSAIAEQEALDAGLPKPDPVGDSGDGIYRIDLLKLLSEGSCHASRDFLVPFFETVSFARLEVVCDHVPRWFPAELPELGLEARVPDAPIGREMTVAVVPAAGVRSAPPGRRPGRQGCSCGG
jgi:Fe-only nitrogenase accessory protein AnfO